MILIPVIDLKGGAVVHARLGQRDSYQPVRTRFGAATDPAAIVGGFLRLHPFHTVYIADLDQIQGGGQEGGQGGGQGRDQESGQESGQEGGQGGASEADKNLAAICALRARFPRLGLWVDAGLDTAAALASWQARGLATPVIGSESLAGAAAWREMREASGADVILSLDFRGGDFLGPPEVLARSESWPDRVIVMTLARVGAGVGPDIEAVEAIRRRAGRRRVFGAGGVRNRRDLAGVAAAGAAGWLIASALHEGGIGPEDIAWVMSSGKDKDGKKG